MFSPIALFVYNRPWHTQQTIESLAKNVLANESDLIIFSDGAKDEKQQQSVHTVREYLKEINGFKSVRIIESPVNRGLANSIISGVSKTFEQYDTLIILEDDLITSPYFLTYMNDALRLYKNHDEVISIHGYIYPVIQQLPETFFLKGADCWGWATWKRGWSLFEADGGKLLQEIQQKDLSREFSFNDTYPFTKMLKNQIKGKIDSWAIRWYASAFVKNKLTLYPGLSLVNNIGNDSSGTHGWNNVSFDSKINVAKINLTKIARIENPQARQTIENYFIKSTPSLYQKIRYKLKMFKV